MAACRNIRRWRSPGRCGRAAACCGLIAATAACDGRAPAAGSAGPADARPAPALRPIRVLIADGADEVRLLVTSSFECFAAGAASAERPAMATAQRLRVDAGGLLQFMDAGSFAGPITIVPRSSGAMTLAARYGPDWTIDVAYGGSITVLTDAARLRVVNEIDLESYVACVVASEVWPGFHDEMYRVQAVAVRSYALDRMMHGSDRLYDVYAGPASQVYRGLRDDAVGRRAWAAAEATRGVVCTWRAGGREAVLPAYYSAACGGVTQSSAVFNGIAPLPPLAGGVTCSGCRAAPDGTYQWETVEIPIAEADRQLRQRLASAAELTSIRSLEISRRSASGRALEVTATDDAGRAFPVGVEDFRLALGGMVVRSTYCAITLEGGVIRFSDGRGFGHGVGLCQWGGGGPGPRRPQRRANPALLLPRHPPHPRVLTRKR